MIRIFHYSFVVGCKDWQVPKLIKYTMITSNLLSFSGLVESSSRNVSRFSVSAGALATNVESRKF